jgi:hypothetical protein
MAEGNVMSRVFAAIVLMTMLTCGARAETIFTATNGLGCKDSSKPEFGDWTCQGPGGYAVRFFDEGNLVGLTIGRSRFIRAATATSQWLGAGKVFGDKVQWIVREGEPKAAVIRIWRRKSPQDDNEIQELAVFAINDRIVYPFANIDIHSPNANETAAREAATAADWYCTEK